MVVVMWEPEFLNFWKLELMNLKMLWRSQAIVSAYVVPINCNQSLIESYFKTCHYSEHNGEQIARSPLPPPQMTSVQRNLREQRGKEEQERVPAVLLSPGRCRNPGGAEGAEPGDCRGRGS